MRLFKEVLIETAEQAEVLPEETVAFAYGPLRGACYTKDAPDNWEGPRRGWSRLNADMVGWTALVPIEAEEETVRPMKYVATCLSFDSDDELPDWLFDGPPRTRLVTPWEEA